MLTGLLRHGASHRQRVREARNRRRRIRLMVEDFELAEMLRDAKPGKVVPMPRDTSTQRIWWRPW